MYVVKNTKNVQINSKMSTNLWSTYPTKHFADVTRVGLQSLALG